MVFYLIDTGKRWLLISILLTSYFFYIPILKYFRHIRWPIFDKNCPIYFVKKKYRKIPQSCPGTILIQNFFFQRFGLELQPNDFINLKSHFLWYLFRFLGFWSDPFMKAFHDAYAASFRDQICGKKFWTTFFNETIKWKKNWANFWPHFSNQT